MKKDYEVPEFSRSLVSQALRDYRKAHTITQEKLAEDLGIEPRTLRLWEKNRPPQSIRELRRISDLLGIEPERLGLTASVYVPKTPEEIEEIIKHVWKLMEESRVNEAHIIIEKLLRDINSQPTLKREELLLPLAHVQHAAGYVTSMSKKTSEVSLPIYHYHELESFARALNDDTLLNIALTYQGDMYRRRGDLTKAISYLEAARDTTPEADVAAQGNALQLLGRVYFLSRDKKGFEFAMGKAEELGHEIQPELSSTHGHYSLGTVYEEYGKSYAALGQTQKALEYLDRAEAFFPKTPFWEVLLMIARAEALIYGGEIESGQPLAIEAANLSKVHGHHRRLERIQSMKQYLHRQVLRFGKAEAELDEALSGPIEPWNVT